MAWTLTHVSARYAVVTLEGGGLYDLQAPRELTLTGGGETRSLTARQVVTCLFGLRPDTAYRLADGEDILDFSTLHEAFTLDVRDFGARGDGTQDDTAAIQAAILACPPQSRVLLPAGVWRVTHLFLRDHLRLELAQGATLLGSYDKAHLPVLPGMLQSWDEETEYNLGTWEGNPLPCYAALLTGLHARDVEIYGPGKVEGSGAPDTWWKDAKQIKGVFRPRLMFLNRCEDVTVAGLTFCNSPSWNLHPYFSNRLKFLGVTVLAPWDSPNTDGFDPESCRDVLLSGARFSLGDDCIAVKSGKIYMGSTYRTPCENLRITHCLMENGHGAVTIGSEMAGGVRGLTVEDCLFRHTDRGLRIKTRRGRGEQAVVEDVYFHRLVMEGVKAPFTANCFYFCDPDGKSDYVQCREKQPVDERTPEIRSLRFADIRCRDAQAAAACFLGLPEKPIGLIEMTGVEVSFAQDPQPMAPVMCCGAEPCVRGGIQAENVATLRLTDVTLHGVTGEKLELRGVEKLEVTGGNVQ